MSIAKTKKILNRNLQDLKSTSTARFDFNFNPAKSSNPENLDSDNVLIYITIMIH
jgi:hypothetical protein